MGMGEQIIIEDRNELYGENAKYKNHNLFIEAGAGAGKTETIINLIVDQLVNGVLPEKIVAITFTNNAAEELLSRISLIIKGKINNEQNNDRKNLFIDVLNNLYKMNVSTIHHFCNVILNENSYKAKISYNSVLLDEDDETKRRDDFYHKWFNSLYENKLDEIYKLNDFDEMKNKATSKLKATFDYLCNQFDDVKVNSKIEFKYYEEFANSISELYEVLNDNLGDCELGSYAQKFEDAFKDFLDGQKSFTDPNIDEYLNSKTSFIRTDIKIKKAKKSNISSDDVAAINDGEIKHIAIKCVELKDLFTKYYKAKPYEVINKYALEAWGEYKKSRDKESLSNNQLIFETYKLFNDNKDVKEKIAKEFDIILVDEFQDTDKYQNKFIIDLALAIDERKKSENTSSTSLILVGDPKQSIYAFRGADFKLFMETRNNFKKSGLSNAINVFLPDNYRSNEYILNWVNDTYSLKNFYKDYEYNNMLLPNSNKLPEDMDKDSLAGVYCYSFNSGDKFKNTANLIKDLVESKYQIYSRNEEGILEARNIKYNDFLVLLTSKSEINEYVSALNKNNIKTLVTCEMNLVTSSKAFNYIYRLIFSIFDKEINSKKLIESNFNFSIYDEKKIQNIKDAIKCFTAYGKLSYIFNNIDLILEEFEDSDKTLLETILSQVLENLSYDENFSECKMLEEIDNLMNETQATQLSLEPNEDAVRIMNVHKCKGLTSEIVIVADSGGFANDGGNCIIDGEVYLHNLEFYKDKKEKKENLSNEEKLRLEYVASTRAKQVMIFESNLKNALFNRKDHGYDFSTLDLYNNGNSLPELVEENLEEDTKDKDFKKITSLTQSKIDKEQLVPKIINLNPSLLEKSGKHGEFKQYKRPANNIFGTIFHRTMELYVLNKDEDIKVLVDRAINENIDDVLSNELDDYKKYLIECAQAVIKLYSNSKLFEIYSIKKPEFKFCDYDDSLYENKAALMTGSMDLLLMNNDKVLIIDYKTDTNSFATNEEFETNLKIKYENQLNTYRKVANKLFNIPLEYIETKIVWLEEKDNQTIAHYLLCN